MHRLGIVLGFVAAVVLFVSIVSSREYKLAPHDGLALVMSLVAGVLVWLVCLGLGWAIEGFHRPD
jgi:hypothetical protein